MKKVKNTIPVYNINALSQPGDKYADIIAEPFSEYLKVHPNLHTPHRHSFYHIVLFTEGGGTHTIDFEQFKVRQGQAYFMIPGQVHSWSFDDKVDGYVINFSDNLFASFLSDRQYFSRFDFFNGIASDGIVQFSKVQYEYVLNCFKQVVIEVHGNKTLALDVVRAQMINIFIAAQRERTGNKPTVTPHQNQLILSNFRKLVDENYAQKRLPKDYAAILYITPNHLNALCNDLLGMPAGEVIRNRILLEAKRLLVNAEKNIAEIAYQLSFTDSPHFTRFFKKYTGTTPEEFRKKTISN